MPHDPPGRSCRNRLFEWTMTGAMLGLAVQLLIWPDSIANSKFQFMLNILDVGDLTALYLVVGSLRLLALFRNGNWPVGGALLRAGCAFCGALAWGQMGSSLILTQSTISATPSPSVSVFAALTVAELYSSYRAAGDVRFR